jgi:folate-binding protein YgfZ
MRGTTEAFRERAMDSPLLRHHQSVGAKVANYFGCALPDVFTDWKDEWRIARESVALFDTNWHAVTSFRGPDRMRYLNAIVTNDLRSLGEWQGTLALLLDPRAHILAELEIYRQRDELLVLSSAAVRERTNATFDKYIIMDDVEMEDASERLGTIALEGPRSGIVLAQATGLSLDGFAEYAGEPVEMDGVECFVSRRSHFGGPGFQVMAPREDLAALWQSLYGMVHASQGTTLGMKALDALRLEAGVPWFPLDFDDSVIPQEAAIEATHLSFTKGCYTGQEIVERVRSRGHVNRRRVRLAFATGEPPLPGTNLRTDTSGEVGHVTSAAFSPAAGTPIGMGYLRSEYSSPGTLLRLEAGTATVLA